MPRINNQTVKSRARYQITGSVSFYDYIVDDQLIRVLKVKFVLQPRSMSSYGEPNRIWRG